jgi:site-specific DNA recombinase
VVKLRRENAITIMDENTIAVIGGEQLFPAEQQRIVRLLIERVIVSPSDLEVRFRPNGIEALALELQPEPVDEAVEEAVA